MTKRTRSAIRAAAAILLAAGLAAGGAVTAQAIPPDGAGPDTPGTSSRVWPAEVKAGELLYFEVSGYPANETVYIKIDDGLMCSDTSHGACVYATQRLDANGYATGSIVVPGLGEGAHWLRMLATGDVFDAKTGEKIGYQGYTRRGGNDFTVLPGGTAGGAAVPGGGAVNSDGTIAGGTVAIDAGEAGATPAPTATPGSMDAITTKIEDDPEAEAAPQAQAEGSTVPVLGIGVLAGAVVLGGAAVTWALLRRRRAASGG